MHREAGQPGGSASVSIGRSNHRYTPMALIMSRIAFCVVRAGSSESSPTAIQQVEDSTNTRKPIPVIFGLMFAATTLAAVMQASVAVHSSAPVM